MDVVDKKTRSRMMSGIRGKNTKPELLIRKHLHRRGFRYRLHEKSVSGRPDLYLPKYNAAIFVNGCFWHFHGCRYSVMPKSNTLFWREKLEKNVIRDRANFQKLLDTNIRVLVVWECALRGAAVEMIEDVVDRIELWLKSENMKLEISMTECSE